MNYGVIAMAVIYTGPIYVMLYAKPKVYVTVACNQTKGSHG